MAQLSAPCNRLQRGKIKRAARSERIFLDMPSAP